MNLRFCISALFFIVFFSVLTSCTSETKQQKAGWPEITQQTKPWTRWWWHGSAVTKLGITQELEALKNKGFGGVEITPIFGVLGQEDNFIDYLSAEWMDMFLHTLSEAERLNLGVDMATGTGWPFGGPWVYADDACKNVVKNSYIICGGQEFTKTISYKQKPMYRTIGLRGNQNKQVAAENTSLTIDQLKEPLEENNNLQALALEQIRFEKELPLIGIMAYSEQGERINLFPLIDKDNKLTWEVPNGKWTVYELYQGWHGKMVERAAPGGEGNVIDHFSEKALTNYLAKFDKAFEGKNISSLRAFFNDSYEVDDARGSSDWTPNFIALFKEQNDYDLLEYLPALFGEDTPEMNERILCDYRATIAQLLLHNFTTKWKNWAHEKGAVVRNQAHGAPANILDLYAEVDIPEMEGKDPLRIKMASSVSNVTGKKLTSSESATWLNEHFISSLTDIKQAMDTYFLSGINHVFYHGTSYSPKDAAWPGWLFYAAVHINDRNPLWEDIDVLNTYLARCQSFLQKGSTDNDVLLYFPVHDRYSTQGKELLTHFDGLKHYEGTYFKQAAQELYDQGYAFDYISDHQIKNLRVEINALKSSGDSYQVLVIPACKYISLETFKHIIELAKQGTQIVFYGGLPTNIAGYTNYKEKESSYKELVDKITWQQNKGFEYALIEKGRLFKGEDLSELLPSAEVGREPLNDIGLSFIRKQSENSYTYFISNPNNERISKWLKLKTSFVDAVIYNPMDATFGKAQTNSDGEIFLDVLPHQSLSLELRNRKVDLEMFDCFTETDSLELQGTWDLKFKPISSEEIPSLKLDRLLSWSTLSEPYASYSGTGVYRLEFNKPEQLTENIKIALGQVESSASVILNGKNIGTLIGPNYELVISSSLLKSESNTLEVEVSSSMTNRIISLDRKGVHWRKFYNVNFPARFSKNQGSDRLFSTSGWSLETAGLLGPVYLINLENKK